jgi:hypothetical protein
MVRFAAAHESQVRAPLLTENETETAGKERVPRAFAIRELHVTNISQLERHMLRSSERTRILHGSFVPLPGRPNVPTRSTKTIANKT